MLFAFRENALNLGIFTQRTFPTQNSMENFLKICVTQQQKGWRKLWVALSKFNRKIWRWLGTLGYLFSLWFAIFLNVMTLPFYIYVYHIASVVLSLLLVLCNHDNLALKLHQKSYLNEGWLFIGKFKIGSSPRMISKEVLAQFLYKLT